MTGPVAGTISWQHDSAFRVVEERVNGAHAATFAFDDDDLLTQAGGLTITREPASGFVTQATAGLVTEAWTYSDYGEVETYTATVGGVVQIAWSYVRDDLGRIVEKTETTPEGTRVLVYEYDLAARLSAVYEDGLLAESYGYDDNGNRLSSLNADGVFDAAFDEQDRLLEYGDESFTWTDNGELLACTDTATGDTTTYAYDAVGNLRGVGLPNGDLVEYLVDGRGRRVGKRVNGVLERGWLWRGQLQPVAELDGAGNVVARFVYAGGVNVPALMVTPTATYRLVTDHLGSVRRVVDVVTGAVVQELEYDAWGRVLVDTSPRLQPFGFAGGLYDPATGLVRFGARDYDAETGRWTAKDPIRFDGGDNLYAYIGGNPALVPDPSGLCAGVLECAWELGEAAGETAGRLTFGAAGGASLAALGAGLAILTWASPTAPAEGADYGINCGDGPQDEPETCSEEEHEDPAIGYRDPWVPPEEDPNDNDYCREVRKNCAAMCTSANEGDRLSPGWLSCFEACKSFSDC
ncbi:MAG: RHS repeat-associated core domain-containing protein [Polyangiaceae bacterium]|nr:RHS repeat-associated core domain-containing protein [Polyangiaceae bacterium]